MHAAAERTNYPTSPRRQRRSLGPAAVCLALSLGASGCLLNRFDDTTTRGRRCPRPHQRAPRPGRRRRRAAATRPARRRSRDEAAADECELFGCDAPVGTTTIAMDPTAAGGFFDAPVAVRHPPRTPTGSIDLTGFPGRSTIPLADIVLGRGEAATFGFGTNSAVFFQATAAARADARCRSSPRRRSVGAATPC